MSKPHAWRQVASRSGLVLSARARGEGSVFADKRSGCEVAAAAAAATAVAAAKATDAGTSRGSFFGANMRRRQARAFSEQSNERARAHAICKFCDRSHRRSQRVADRSFKSLDVLKRSHAFGAVRIAI